MADAQLTITLDDLNIQIPVALKVGEFGMIEMGTVKLTDSTKFMSSLAELLRLAADRIDERTPGVQIVADHEVQTSWVWCDKCGQLRDSVNHEHFNPRDGKQ
jgi:hypothetical protein